MVPALRIACLATLALATPALARDVYECSFPEVANNLGYLPPTVIMSPSGDGKTATVVDGFIQGVEGGPIEAKIADESDRKLSVSWSLNLASTSSSRVKVHYRLSVQKGSLDASMTGRPLNYSNVFTAQGKCTRKKA